MSYKMLQNKAMFHGSLSPRPQDGADPVYDEKCRQIRSTQQELEKELEGLRQKYPKVRHARNARNGGAVEVRNCYNHGIFKPPKVGIYLI